MYLNYEIVRIMAKYYFTQEQFEAISLLLKRRKYENHDEQKRTRAQIRNLGFRISEYYHGFSETDFKNLLTTGEVKIVGKQVVVDKPPIGKTSERVNPISTPEILKQGLAPIVDEETEFLILGTMPGEQSLKLQEYYSNPSNQFWIIISTLFNSGKRFLGYNHKIAALKKNKIGLWDVLNSCIRDGSLDSNIKNATTNDFGELFGKFPNIHTIIFNGQDSYTYFMSTVKLSSCKTYIQLSSTSSANTHRTLEEKIQEWKSALIK